MVAPAGTIEHVGTQYLVTVRDAATLLAVREGALRLLPAGGSTPGESFVVPQGRQVEFAPGQEPAWSGLAPHDRRWNWVSQAAAPMQIDGRSVRAFLDWICRENGWRWTVVAGVEAAELDGILLRGSIEGLVPRDAIGLVAAVAELSIELDADAGTISVGRAPAQDAGQ